MRRVVHYAAAPVAGGLLTHVRLLAGRTARRGYAPEVWMRPASSLDGVAADLEKDGVEVRRICVEGKTDLRGMMAFTRALRKASPDIVHLHLASPVESLPVIFLAGRFSRARLVATEHAPHHHPLERAWSRPAKRRAARRIARVIALSQNDASHLVREFGLPQERLRCIPNGVALPASSPPRDACRSRFGIPEGATVIGYVGEIAVRKGLGDLLTALETLPPETMGRPVLLLAGEGPFGSVLRERAQRGGFADRVRLPGPVRPPDAVFAASDLFVLPSHGEAMPLALLEAMAAGLPVVATQVGGIPEVIRDGVEGKLVRPGDPAALLSALMPLIADADLRARMGLAARARVAEAYTIDRMVSRVCDLYDEVLGGATP